MINNDKDPAEIVEGTEQEQRQADPLALYKDPQQWQNLLQAAELQEGEKVEPLRPLLRYIDGKSTISEACNDYRPVDFLCRGTLTMITGQKGSRKSTLVRALCAVLLNSSLHDGICPDTLKALQPGLRIATVDTEQHRSRVANLRNWLQRTYRGTENFADRCGYYSARGLGVDELRALCVAICETKHPDVLFLDVIRDFVEDINNQEQSKFVIDFINNLCNRYGVAVVGIIHQNPSKEATAGDKMAGALGTKLLQAAEAVLHIDRVKPGAKMIDPDKVEKDYTGDFIFGRASVITFAEYRDRWPDITTMLLKNENAKGEFALSLQPAQADEKQVAPGLSKTQHFTLQPARLVSAAARQIEEREQKENTPELPIAQAANIAAAEEQPEDDLPF